jgi:hypothetical protein
VRAAGAFTIRRRTRIAPACCCAESRHADCAAPEASLAHPLTTTVDDATPATAIGRCGASPLRRPRPVIVDAWHSAQKCMRPRSCGAHGSIPAIDRIAAREVGDADYSFAEKADRIPI